jgi:hypothetical protein
MRVDVEELRTRLRKLPFQTGHPLLCRYISNTAAIEFAHRLRAISQAQIRIKLTACFREAIYTDSDAGAAAQQILHDFNLCAVFGSHAIATESLVHEFDQDDDNDTKQEACQDALMECNQITGNMMSEINVLLGPGGTGTVDELPSLKIPPERARDPAAEFQKTTENLLVTLTTLDGLISTSGQLGALFHQYCNAVYFPHSPELTAQTREISENGKTIANEATEALEFLRSEIARIQSGPGQQP